MKTGLKGVLRAATHVSKSEFTSFYLRKLSANHGLQQRWDYFVALHGERKLNALLQMYNDKTAVQLL